MVKLVVNNDVRNAQIIELALATAGITYDLDFAESEYGLMPPCLIVDGVPLDLDRALKWIGEQKNG